LIHDCGKDGNDHQGKHYEGEVEDLKAINDEVAESFGRNKEFPYDDADPGEADIHFQCRDDCWEGGG